MHSLLCSVVLICPLGFNLIQDNQFCTQSTMWPRNGIFEHPRPHRNCVRLGGLSCVLSPAAFFPLLGSLNVSVSVSLCNISLCLRHLLQNDSVLSTAPMSIDHLIFGVNPLLNMAAICLLNHKYKPKITKAQA